MSPLANQKASYIAVRKRLYTAPPKPKAPEPEVIAEPEPIRPAIVFNPVVETVEETMDDGAERCTSKEILRQVAESFGMTVGELIGGQRSARHVSARAIAAHRMRRKCPAPSLPVIGRLMGDRDHTTILHLIRVYDENGQKRFPYGQQNRIYRALQKEAATHGWNRLDGERVPK